MKRKEAHSFSRWASILLGKYELCYPAMHGVIGNRSQMRNRLNFITAIVVVAATFVFVASSYGQETGESILIKEYLENCGRVEEYVCGMDVEQTVENARDIALSSYSQQWLTHAFSQRLKVHRQDTITTITSAFADRLPFPSVLIVQNDKVHFEVGGKITDYSKLILEDAKNFNPTFYGDPFSVFLAGYFERRNLTELHNNSLKNALERYEVLDSKEDLVSKQQTYSIFNDDPIFSEIVFDMRLGGMPKTIVSSTPQSRKTQLPWHEVDFNWISHDEKWFPDRVHIVERVGKLTRTWDINFYWVLAEVPDIIFDFDRRGKMHPKELKEMILARHIKKNGLSTQR